jgi:hypothetical protein
VYNLSLVSRGEICVHSAQVTAGYFKNELETEESRIDGEPGWMRTGDIGEMANGRLKVIDRKKNFFKLSLGEFVSAVKLELIYEQSPAVRQIFIHGESIDSFIVAVIVPSPEFVRKHRSTELGNVHKRVDFRSCNNTASSAPQSINDDLRLAEMVMAELTAIARAHKLRAHEIPRGILLDEKEWTTANELLTPSSKIRRTPLLRKYKRHIDKLYETLRGRETPASPASRVALASSGEQIAAASTSALDHVKSIASSLLGVNDRSQIDPSRSFIESGGTSVSAVIFASRVRDLIESSGSSVQAPPINFILYQSLQAVAAVVDKGLNMQVVDVWIANETKLLVDILDTAATLDADLRAQSSEASDAKAPNGRGITSNTLSIC